MFPSKLILLHCALSWRWWGCLPELKWGLSPHRTTPPLTAAITLWSRNLHGSIHSIISSHWDNIDKHTILKLNVQYQCQYYDIVLTFGTWLWIRVYCPLQWMNQIKSQHRNTGTGYSLFPLWVVTAPKQLRKGSYKLSTTKYHFPGEDKP